MTKEILVHIVDDDSSLCDSLIVLLGAHDVYAQAFSSANDFLANLPPQSVGCVLIDIQMPGISGIELLGELANRRFHLPCVMMTGFGKISIAVQAMKAGAHDFIEKPFEANILIEAVQRAINHSRSDESRSSAGSGVDKLFAQITPRERDVLKQMVLGHPNKMIAHELGISPRTVEVHRARVMDKLDARSVADVVRLALAAGLIS
jgi:two-component system response regulator FixJ